MRSILWYFTLSECQTCKFRRNMPVYHALGNGEFDLFMKMAKHIVCAKAVLTPENCIHEVERVIVAAMEYRHPVYIAIPKNYVNQNVSFCPALVKVPVKSDHEVLEEVVSPIINKLSNSKKACSMPGIFVDHFGLKDLTTAVVNASGLPYVTIAMDESVLDETNPSYLGLYSGHFVNLEIRDFVESCDCILAIGTVLSDINLGVGKFSATLDKSHVINIMPSEVHIGHADYPNLQMSDVLNELSKRLHKSTGIRGPLAKLPTIPKVDVGDLITADYLYASYATFFKPDDIIIVDLGTSIYGSSLVFYRNCLRSIDRHYGGR